MSHPVAQRLLSRGDREALRAAGHEVYDFRNPHHGGNGFRWTDIDEDSLNWTFEQYAEGLHHPKIWMPKNGPTTAYWYFLADVALILKPEGWLALENVL